MNMKVETTVCLTAYTVPQVKIHWLFFVFKTFQLQLLQRVSKDRSLNQIRIDEVQTAQKLVQGNYR